MNRGVLGFHSRTSIPQNLLGSQDPVFAGAPRRCQGAESNEERRGGRYRTQLEERGGVLTASATAMTALVKRKADEHPWELVRWLPLKPP